MTDLNSILVEGELVDDPQKGREGDPGVCKFVLATRRTTAAGEKQIAHLDVIVAGRMAEVCNEYLKKGRRVRVVGRLATKEGEDATEFFARRFTHIIAEHVEFKPQPFTGKDQSIGKPTETADLRDEDPTLV